MDLFLGKERFLRSSESLPFFVVSCFGSVLDMYMYEFNSLSNHDCIEIFKFFIQDHFIVFLN